MAPYKTHARQRNAKYSVLTDLTPLYPDPADEQRSRAQVQRTLWRQESG